MQLVKLYFFGYEIFALDDDHHARPQKGKDRECSWVGVAEGGGHLKEFAPVIIVARYEGCLVSGGQTHSIIPLMIFH